MQQSLAVPGTLVMDAAVACGDASRSPLGEECHLRVRGTNGTYSIVDYRAPAGFGPARHTHRREDEIIQLLEGRIVVWTPQRGFTMSPGDVVLLPKEVPHAWRAFGQQVHGWNAVRNPGISDLRLGPGQAFGHRGLGDQERPRDLGRGQSGQCS